MDGCEGQHQAFRQALYTLGSPPTLFSRRTFSGPHYASYISDPYHDRFRTGCSSGTLDRNLASYRSCSDYSSVHAGGQGRYPGAGSDQATYSASGSYYFFFLSCCAPLIAVSPILRAVSGLTVLGCLSNLLASREGSLSGLVGIQITSFPCLIMYELSPCSP